MRAVLRAAGIGMLGELGTLLALVVLQDILASALVSEGGATVAGRVAGVLAPWIVLCGGAMAVWFDRRGSRHGRGGCGGRGGRRWRDEAVISRENE